MRCFGEEADPLEARIVSLLARTPQGLSFTDIVRYTGKPRETVNRRLKCLVEHGILSKRREGRKVIYRLSHRNLRFIAGLMVHSVAITEFFHDHLKAFRDLLAEGRSREAAIALCFLAGSFPSFFVGYAGSTVSVFYEFARSIIESLEAPSFSELERILNGVARLIAFYAPYDLAYGMSMLVPVAAAEAVARSIRRGVKPDLEFHLESCIKEGVDRGEWRRVLELLGHSEYGKRLLRVYSVEDPEASYRVLVEEYGKVAKLRICGELLGDEVC